MCISDWSSDVCSSDLDAVIDDLRAMAGKHPSGMSANAGGENVDRSALRAPFDEWGDGPGLSSHAIGTPEYRREIIRKAFTMNNIERVLLFGFVLALMLAGVFAIGSGA